jgi:hypothetical protein
MKSVNIRSPYYSNGVWQMIRNISLFLLIFMVILPGCSKSTPSATNPEVLSTSTPPPSPESGMATIVGQIMHQDGHAMSNTIIRLADVARGAEGKGGAYILDIARSPGTITDENGRFIIQNVKAGEYVLVVGDIELTGIYEIIKETNGQAKVWTFPADKVTDVGVLIVNIVPPTPIPTTTPGPYPEPTPYPYP